MKRILVATIAVLIALPTAAFGVWDGGDGDGLAETGEAATLTVTDVDGSGTHDINVTINGLRNDNFAAGPYAALDVNKITSDPAAIPTTIKLSRVIRVHTGWTAGKR